MNNSKNALTFGILAAAAVSASAVFADEVRDYEPGRYANTAEKAKNILRYSLQPKRLFEKIAAGKMAIGAYIGLRDPQIAEIAGCSGLDYVWIDAEHHALTVADLQAMQIALDGTGCASMIRVRSSEATYLKPILDIGVDAILFPHVSGAKEARAAVAACRYPQAGGKRGVCVSRASGYGRLGIFDYFKKSETWPLVLIQIEDMECYRELDEILAIDGVDGIMVGPCDLSCSLGALKKQGSEEVQKLMDDVAARTHKAGKLFYNIGGYASSVRRLSDFHDVGSDTSAAEQWKREVDGRGAAKISTFAVHIGDFMKESGCSLEYAVAEFKRAGVTGFDGEYTDPALDSYKAAGLEAVMIYGIMSFRDPKKDEIEQKRYLDRALSLGAKYMMIVPDMFDDLKDDPDSPEYRRELDKVIDGLKRLCAKCKAAGICPMVEDFGYRINPGSHFKNLKKIFAEVPDLYFALDTGNVMFSNRGENILDEYYYFKDKVRHVHIKDHPAGDCEGYALPGEGVVPNAGLLKDVFRNGYEGWVTLELFGAPNMLEAVQKTCRFINSMK